MALTSTRGAETLPPDDAAATPDASPPAQAASELTQRRVAVPEKLHHVLVSILAAFVALPSVFWWVMQSATIIKDPGGFDFCIYFAAALALHDNPHTDIFDLHVIQAAALRHQAPNPVQPYLYPPLMAILLIPLTRFSYVEAARIWVGVNLTLWILATGLLAMLLVHAFTGLRTAPRVSASPSRRARAVSWLRDSLASWRHPSTVAVFALGIAVFASLSHEPAVKGVMLGQVSILIFFLLVLAPWLLRNGQPELAGVALALATTIKVLPIVLIGYYLLRGRWRVVAGAVVCFAVLGAFMLHVVGVPGLLASKVIFTAGSLTGLEANNQALAHVPMWIAAELGRQPGPKTLRLGYVPIALVACVFAAGMLVTAWRDLRTRGRAGPERAAASPHDLVGYAWAICTMLLVSPIVWEHYGEWLLPAFACCLGYAAYRLVHRSPGAGDRARMWQATFAVVAVVIGYALTARLFPFNYDSEASLSPGPYLWHIAIRPLFMVLRPLGTTLVWLALGWFFLWPRLGARQPPPVESNAALLQSQAVSASGHET